MNAKRKGSRNELRARDMLREQGYDLIFKSGGSFGLFDLIGLSANYDRCVLVQVKSNRCPSGKELDLLKAVLVPSFCLKQVWTFHDYRGVEIMTV